MNEKCLVTSLFAALSFVALSCVIGGSNSMGMAATPDLLVQLKADKNTVGVGDVIEFTEVLHNSGSKIIQLIDDKCGYGKDIQLRSLNDGKYANQCEGSGGGHTLKPGLRPGKRVLLKPNGEFTRKFRAYLSSDYCLCFQNHGDAGFTGFVKTAENAHHVPAEFYGCGCMYALKSAGRFQAVAKYDNDFEWSTGEIPPKEPLWKGSASSNEIELNFK